MKRNPQRTKKSQVSRSRKPPLVSKVIQQLRKEARRQVIDIQEVRNAQMHAEELNNTVITKEKMDTLDPLHAVYTYAQNKMSVFVEQLAEVPALSKLYDLYEAADDEYLPKGPPVSPLTRSYFTCWGFFDLCVGLCKESLGVVVTEVCKELKADQSLIQTFEIMQASRMGLYVHAGFSEDFVRLREFITGKQLEVKVISGYKGHPGEIWLARLLPPPYPLYGLDYHIVFTTPYVIGTNQDSVFFLLGDEQGWEDYFARTLRKVGARERIEAYQQLMKYGLSRHYWNEYIFEAYVNFTHDSVILTGFPDIPLSRPHSKESDALH